MHDGRSWRHSATNTVEAEITGGLEHPSIVPVYGLGHTSDGRPFYAMRFIRGDSLKEAIRRFHDAEKDRRRDPSQSALELRFLTTGPPSTLAACSAPACLARRDSPRPSRWSSKVMRR